jgi:enoyl-CoA hydratase/carnithine racemase
MIYTGVAMKSEAALECGLVDIVADDPLDEALNLAKELAAKAPVALKLAKACLNRSEFVNIEAGLEFEADTWASLFDTSDQKEGMRAFIEKRKPAFTGK